MQKVMHSMFLHLTMFVESTQIVVATSAGMEIGHLPVILKQEILAMLKFLALNVQINVQQLLDAHIIHGLLYFQIDKKVVNLLKLFVDSIFKAVFKK